MASVTQLGYLGIGVSDPAQWERFATDVLGLEVNGADADGSIFLRMDEYHHRFILQPGGPDDVAFVGWEVRDQTALNEVAAQLRDERAERRHRIFRFTVLARVVGARAMTYDLMHQDDIAPDGRAICLNLLDFVGR